MDIQFIVAGNKMNKLSLKIQIILTYSTITLAVIISLFALGFMSGFYTLFMNGNDIMYTFFKDLQVMNTSMFTAGLIFFVLSLFLIPFDINKKAAGIFGVFYTLIIAVTNIINGISILTTSRYFQSVYEQIDFNVLEDYSPSTALFEMTSTLYSLTLAIPVLLFALTITNYLIEKKKGKLSEK